MKLKIILIILMVFNFSTAWSLVNINTADSEELQTLKGIGKKKASDIIIYRETHGLFRRIDDLVQVKGIGEKTLNKLRMELTVSETKAIKKPYPYLDKNGKKIAIPATSIRKK